MSGGQARQGHGYGSVSGQEAGVAGVRNGCDCLRKRIERSLKRRCAADR